MRGGVPSLKKKGRWAASFLRKGRREAVVCIAKATGPMFWGKKEVGRAWELRGSHSKKRDALLVLRGRREGSVIKTESQLPIPPL